MEMKNLDQMLRSFQDDLPPSSRTAAAIDRGAGLEEISELAEEEGFYKLASVLFEAEQEALREGAGAVEDPAEAILSFLRDMRKDLPESSRTAAAIDRNASWEEISEIAEEEGLHQVASVLFEAGQEQLRSPS